VTESIFNKHENILGRFFFIFGHTNDCFCDRNYIDVSLEYALNEHLKKLGYKRIVFYSRAKKLYCHDRESFNLVKNPQASAPADAGLKKTIAKRLLTGPVSGKLKPAGQSSEAGSENSGDVLHFRKMDENTAFQRIDFCMRNNNAKTAAIFTNADDIIRHFGETQGIRSMVSDAFNRYENLEYFNHNIVIFIFPKGLGDAMSTYEHIGGNDGAWPTFFKPRIEKGSAILNIDPPAAGEIRNAINYYRLRHGLSFDFSQLDDVCKKIAKAYNGEKKRSLKELMMNLEKFTVQKQTLDNRSCDTIIGKKNDKSALQKLEELIGMQSVKDEIKRLQAVSRNKSEGKKKIASGDEYRSRILPPVTANDNGDGGSDQYLHYIVTGNPGTGKTTFANLLGEIYHELGYLSSGHTVKATESDLVAGYIGQSAIKTRQKIEEAMGGVLFIEEAYSLVMKTGGNAEFANEAITTLLEAMSAHNGRFAVVAAGYPNEMEVFRDANPGFKRRFKKTIRIDDYTPKELRDIFDMNLLKRNYRMDSELSAVIDVFFENWFKSRDEINWGNAGEVIKLVTAMYESWCMHPGEEGEDGIIILTINDIPSEIRRYCYHQTQQKTSFESISREKMCHDTNTREQIDNSLLFIRTESKNGEQGFASGFIITRDGYAVTCNHAIEDAAKIEVRLEMPRIWITATVVHTNKDVDIALLKIDGENYQAIKLQRPDMDPSKGDEIYLLSYPFGNLLSDTLTDLNATRFDGRIASIQRINNLDRINLDIQAKRGSSGGCVIAKATNEVVGILCGSQVSGDDLPEEINHAAPIKYVWQEFINQE